MRIDIDIKETPLTNTYHNFNMFSVLFSSNRSTHPEVGGSMIAN